MRDLVRALVKFEVDPAVVAFLNSSEKKAQNMAALLLNDVYALLGAQMGLDALANTRARHGQGAAVKRGKLRRAFDDEFAARIEQAFLDVTASHVRRRGELRGRRAEQVVCRRMRWLSVQRGEAGVPAQHLSRVPKKIREWLGARKPWPAKRIAPTMT